MLRKLLRFLFWVALTLGVLTGLLRLTAIRWWRVPSDDPYLTASLSPTLRPGDLVVLWRASRPGFSDLVMCPEPKHPERVAIGRIAGVGGDEVQVKHSEITVNNKRQHVEGDCPERKFVEKDPGTGFEVELACSLEALGPSTNYRAEVPTSGNAPPDVKASVPEGHVWLVSDNRQFPWDSREFGPVPRETCKESVVFRLVSRHGFSDAANRLQFVR